MVGKASGTAATALGLHAAMAGFGFLVNGAFRHFIAPFR